MKCEVDIKDDIELLKPIPKLALGTIFILTYEDKPHIIIKHFGGYVSLTDPNYNWSNDYPPVGFIRALKPDEKVTLTNE